MNSTFVFDAHVHFYPQYDSATALHCALRNLPKIYPLAELLSSSRRDNASAPKLTLCLAERSDCHFFRDLFLRQNIRSDSTLRIEPIATDAPAARIHFASGAEILIVPGRQIISAERLEILSFSLEIDVPDKTLSYAEICKIIWSEGGIPAINWAPGKWFGARGKLVKRVLNDETVRPLLLCDTTLRPTFWPEPILMRKAPKLGVKVIGGSDPLPFANEEKRIGTYATVAHGAYNHADPVVSLRNLVLDPQVKFERIGTRSALPAWSMRMGKLYSRP